MDPQPERTPGLALPKPSPEQGSFNAAPTASGIGAHEALLPAVEAPLAPAMAPPMAAPPAQLPTAQPHALAPAAPVANPLTATTTTDDNTSTLDDEWISKAKAIVEQTKHDPHLESRELSKVKADYLRIRYNKHIKVVEESK